MSVIRSMCLVLAGTVLAGLCVGCAAMPAQQGAGDQVSLMKRAKKAPANDNAALTEKQAMAIAAANKWLFLCDTGTYGESWTESASAFQKALKKEQWEQTVALVRDPLGKAEKRGLKSSAYQTSYPGLPDGEYLVMELNTVFQNKKAAVETVIVTVDGARGWRVMGYFIK